MAHCPLDLQTGLSGRSFITYSVGCAPGYKGGILLFNPTTKRYIVRRTFKVMGPTMPLDYHVPIQFEATDTYTDDSESPDPEDNLSPADEQDLELLHQDKRQSASSTPNHQAPPRDSLQLLPQNSSSVLPPNNTLIPSVPSSVTPTPIAPVSVNRSRAKKSAPGDSLVNIRAALSVSTYRSQLPLLMDNLLDNSVSMDDFSHQLDTYIQQLPANLHKPLQKRAQIIGQALYKKPEVAQVYAFQTKPVSLG